MDSIDKMFLFGVDSLIWAYSYTRTYFDIVGGQFGPRYQIVAIAAGLLFCAVLSTRLFRGSGRPFSGVKIKC